MDADVAIVGFGPVGQALAILLGRAGHEVVCLERHEEIYRMPRAVHIDHDTGQPVWTPPPRRTLHDHRAAGITYRPARPRAA